MREKIRATEPMMTADQAREHARSPLDLLIRHHVDRGSSRMHAYERVGRQIGRTPAWIQRVLGRRDDAAVGLHDAFNIRAAYDRLCARVEAAAERVEADNHQLREALDAALSARGAPPEGAGGARFAPQEAPRGEPGPAASALLVRPAVGAPRSTRSRSGQAAELTDLPLWRAAEGE